MIINLPAGTDPVQAITFQMVLTSTSAGSGFGGQFIFGPVLTPTNAYWSGAKNSVWNTDIEPGDSTNWTTAPTGGVDTNQVPGAITDVYFTANSASNLSTTLGQDFSIKGLFFTGTGTAAGSGSVTIGGANTLTIGADGITSQVGTAADTISSKVALGANETWTNNSANLLTVSGPVSGAFQLIKSGTGALLLSGSNSYSVGTKMTAGTLIIGSPTALGGGAFTITGGSLDTVSGGVTMTNAIPINIDTSFTFDGTGNLNLGAGKIVDGSSYTITLDGSGTTLTMGGVLMNNLAGNQTTTVDGHGNTLVLGGYALSNSATSYDDAFGGNGNVTITGPVINGGTATNSGLAFLSSGTLTLSGSNSYSGGTTMNNGTLQLDNTYALGAVTGSLVDNGGILNLNGFSPTVGALSGSATGLIEIKTGGTSTFTVDTIANTTYNGELANGAAALTLVKSGTGSLTLSGSDHYSGGTFIYAGTLQVGNTYALGSLPANLAVYGGTLNLDGFSPSVGTLTGSAGALITNSAAGPATLTLNETSNNTYAGALSDGVGTVALVKGGTWTLTLSASNHYSGGTVVNAGTVQLGNTFALGSTTGNLTVNGGTVNLAGFSPTIGALSGSAGGVITTSGAGTTTLTTDSSSGTTYAGLLSNGSGHLALVTDGTGTLILSASNTYGAGTTIDAGTLQLGNTFALGSTTGSLTVNGGTLNLDGYSPTVGALSGSGAGIVINTAAGTATLTANSNTNSTYAGEINNNGGAIALVKSGTGMLTLSGSSTYNGGTTVNAGVLQVGNTFALGAVTSSLAVNGGEVDLDGFSPTVGALSGSSGALITTTKSGTLVTLTTNSSASNTYAGLLSNGAGQLALTKGGAGTLTLSASNSYSGATDVTGGTLAITGAINAPASAFTVDGSGAAATLGTSAFLSASNTYIGVSSSGSFTQSGGTESDSVALYIGDNAGSTGVYNLVGGTLQTPYAYVGYSGSGGFIQTGGTDFKLTDLYVGFNAGSTGTYTLSAGTLQTQYNYVGYSGSGAFTNSGGLDNTTSDLIIGEKAGSDGVYTLSGGLTQSPITYIGYGGTGTFVQNGGSHTTGATVLGENAGSTGTYILKAGTLTASYVTGGAGTSVFDFDGGILKATGSNSGFMAGLTTANVQTGGALINPNGFAITISQALLHDTTSGAPAFDGGLKLIGTGTLTLSGNNSYTGPTDVTGGMLAITGAINAGSSNFTVDGSGASATLNGSLFATNAYIGLSGSGVFTQTGGTQFDAYAYYETSGDDHEPGALYMGYNAGSNGVYNLSGGSLKSLGICVAYSGSGGFIQTGGTVAATFTTAEGTPFSFIDEVCIGFNAGSTGAYTMSAGSLQTSGVYVGSSGSGAFVNSGGLDDNTGALVLGQNAGSDGVYTLSGGLTESPNTTIGAGGTGSFIQNGGTQDAGAVIIGQSVGSTGTYKLNGGTLNASSVTGGSGTSVFDFNGGTLKPTASSATFMTGLTTVNVQTGGAIINPNGFAITIPQALLHDTTSGAPAIDGGLKLLGAGALTLSGSNTYTGATTVSSGTLNVTGAVSNTASASVASGAALEVDGLLNSTATSTVGGILRGQGSVGAITVQSGGTLAPGLSSFSSAAGVLTANGNLSLTNTTSIFSIRLGVVHSIRPRRTHDGFR